MLTIALITFLAFLIQTTISSDHVNVEDDYFMVHHPSPPFQTEEGDDWNVIDLPPPPPQTLDIKSFSTDEDLYLDTLDIEGIANKLQQSKKREEQENQKMFSFDSDAHFQSTSGLDGQRLRRAS